MIPRINSHNSWSRLEEVLLGDVYPVEWYEHLQPDVRDVFQRLTENTQEDLKIIQKKLEEFGVVVQRPVYTNIESHLLPDGTLIKPSICPRDSMVTIGNTLYVPHKPIPMPEWEHVFAQYRSEPGCGVAAAFNFWLSGANTVRVGRDIIIDTDIFDWTYENQLPEYRVQLEKNGGHMDGCFAILKPGLILANRYFDGYDRTFPGWEIIYLDNPSYATAVSTGHKHAHPPYNGKFWDTTVGSNKSFNQHIVQHALDWVGDYRETYFELNCLSIDEKNVIMLAENEQVANDLERRGVTVHWVPFRTRSFWDGAMHCLTVDIRRQSSIEDFFPERG